MEVLSKINQSFTEFDIDEVGIVMTQPPEPPIVIVEKKLGISQYIIKPLFIYVLQKFHAIYGTIRKGISSLALTGDEIISLTRVILLIKGDMPLALAMRKELIDIAMICIEDELKFIQIVFPRHPKSPSLWQHRRWVLIRTDFFIANKCLSKDQIENELKLCSYLADIYPKNYYAWCHRLWVLQYLTRDGLEKELMFTETWLSSHLTDHSCSSHRNQIVSILLNNFFSANANEENVTSIISVPASANAEEAIKSESILLSPLQSSGYKLRQCKNIAGVVFLFECLTVSASMLVDRPGHESLWYHRRYQLIIFSYL